jgi:hypothetical protein
MAMIKGEKTEMLRLIAHEEIPIALEGDSEPIRMITD